MAGTIAARSQSISAEVSAIVGISGNANMLEALARVVAAGERISKTQAIEDLVERLNDGAEPTVLADQILAKAELLHFYQYQRDASQWSYGTLSFRGALSQFLVDEAKQSNGSSAQRYARAALLFVVQDGLLAAGPSLFRLISDSVFGQLCGWDGGQLDKMKQLANMEHARTQAFGEHVVAAGTALQGLIDHPTAPLNSTAVTALFTALEIIADLAPYRAEMQYRLANFAWRIANLSRAVQDNHVLDQTTIAVARWKQSNPEAHAVRWFNDAMVPGPAPKSIGIRLVSSDEFAKSLKPKN